MRSLRLRNDELSKTVCVLAGVSPEQILLLVGWVNMPYLTLALCLLVASSNVAAQTVEESGESSSDTHDPGAILVLEELYPVELGDPLAQIGGGPLEEPFTVPLWIELDADDSENCDVLTDLLILPLEGNRIYLDQQNIICRGDTSPSCRVLDLGTHVLNRPSSCLHSLGGGSSYRADALGSDWFVLHTFIEGPNVAALVQWSPEGSMIVHLEHISGSQSVNPVTRRDDEFLIESICDPLLGTGCDYYTLMHHTAPVRLWRWNPESAPEELTVEVPQDGSR